MSAQGFLRGYFLAAMPDMSDERFFRSVIYICSHSPEGAMGFILNRPHTSRFLDLVVQLELVDSVEEERLPGFVFNQMIRYGGPVEPGRGFVLHSDDYIGATTTRVGEGIGLTSTVDILRLLAQAKGPCHALIALGYAGWTSGQLDREIAANGWLVAPATPELVFNDDIETLYERVLTSIGVDLSRFVSDAGHS